MKPHSLMKPSVIYNNSRNLSKKEYYHFIVVNNRRSVFRILDMTEGLVNKVSGGTSEHAKTLLVSVPVA